MTNARGCAIRIVNAEAFRVCPMMSVSSPPQPPHKRVLTPAQRTALAQLSVGEIIEVAREKIRQEYFTPRRTLDAVEIAASVGWGKLFLTIHNHELREVDVNFTVRKSDGENSPKKNK